jgi:Phytanoyl-CoA dioxygenase (PhyH)
MVVECRNGSRLPKRRATISRLTGLGTLPEVDALEADGRLLEAIDALRASGAPDDLEVARRLLRLRYEAFGRLDRDRAPGAWPPAWSDPRPDVAGPPELDPSELSAETVGGAIRHHGSVIVRQMAPPAVVRALTDGIEASFAAIDAWVEAGRTAEATSEWFVPFATDEGQKPAMREWVRAGGGVWAVESPLVARRVLDLYHSVGLRELLTGYLGEPPATSLEKLTLRKVEPDTIPSWHQDGSFLGDDTRSLNVWLALTDCGGDAPVPGLEIVPRRVDELLETGTRGSVFPNSIGHELVEEIAGSTPIVRPEFRAGDALLFDDRMVHRSAVSEGMHGCRYAIESWFFPASGIPAGYQGLAF